MEGAMENAKETCGIENEDRVWGGYFSKGGPRRPL